MKQYWLIGLTVVQLAIAVVLVIMCQKIMWLKDSVKTLQSQPVTISSPAEVVPVAEPSDAADNAVLEPEIVIEVETSPEPVVALDSSVEEELPVLEIASDESADEPEEQFFDDLPAEDRVAAPVVSAEEQAIFDEMAAQEAAEAEAAAAAEAQAVLDAEAEAAEAEAIYNESSAEDLSDNSDEAPTEAEAGQ